MGTPLPAEVSESNSSRAGNFMTPFLLYNGHFAYMRAACWALRAVWTARAKLANTRFDHITLPSVPAVSASAELGVTIVLRYIGPTCLVRSIVRQSWYAAHGSPRDLVIGVTAPGQGFQAHAWLEGDSWSEQEGFEELMRAPAKT